MVKYHPVTVALKGKTVNQNVPTKLDLIAQAQCKYWEQRICDPGNQTMVPLVQSVLDNNGMANDPAYWETVSDICSHLARYDHRQMILDFTESPHRIY